MATIFILFVTLIVLDIAALKWGLNSRDGHNSPEWERKWQSGRLFY